MQAPLLTQALCIDTRELWPRIQSWDLESDADPVRMAIPCSEVGEGNGDADMIAPMAVECSKKGMRRDWDFLPMVMWARCECVCVCVCV